MVFSCLSALGQDIQFSQYYASPLYLNPAFTGTAPGHRLSVIHRNQWPQIGNGFVSSAVSYDYNKEDLRSGFGLLVMQDRAGTAGLTSTSVAFNYAYKVQLSKKWMFTPGLYFGYNRRSMDFSRLVFGDQLGFNSSGEIVGTNDRVLNNLDAVDFFDVGTGMLLYNRKYWLGMAMHHINQPNQSLIGEESRWPRKISVHGGAQFPLYTGVRKRNKISSLAPSFNYKRQGTFDQLDLGLHFLYDPIMIGLWYRGIPLKQNVEDRVNQDAVVIILGLRFKNLDVGYSYDFTTSQLNLLSGGAHEVSIKYEFETFRRDKVRKRDKFIPCPTFIPN